MMLQGDSIPDRMVISLKGKSALYKGDLMMLEMIDQCNWTAPSTWHSPWAARTT